MLFQLSDLYVYNNPQSALNYSQQALVLSKKISDTELISKSYYQIGSAYWSKGELAKALEQLQFSLAQISDDSDVELLCRIYMRIGAIYSASDDNVKGIYYYQKSIPFFDQLENDFIKFATYSNIGKALLDTRYLDSAAGYFDTAIGFEESIPPRFLPIILFNLADLHYQKNEFEQAETKMIICDSLASIYGDLRSQIRVSQLRAEIALQQNQLQKSLMLIEKAIRMAKSTKARELIAITSASHSKVLDSLGQDILAFKALKTSRIYYDSIQSTQSKNKLELFNFDESEREKDELRKLQEISELKASNQQMVAVVAAIISFLMLAIAYTSYRSRQLIKLQNKNLHEKNRLIESQKAQLDALDVFKTKVMGIMAHDVRGPLQSIFGIIDILDHQLKSPEELADFLPHIKEQLAQVSLLLNNIFEWSKAGINENRIESEKVSIYEIINVCIDENELTAKNKNLQIQNSVPTDQMVFADPRMLKVVVRNLLYNSIKYSNDGDRIVFKGGNNESQNIFSISDQGIGMSEDQINKLFSYHTESELGTAKEIGSGFGLIICKDFIEMNQGSIRVQSKKNTGTTFTIELPKP